MHRLVQHQETINCRRCGKPFVSINTTGRAGRAAYCPECRDEIYSERARRRREYMKKWELQHRPPKKLCRMKGLPTPTSCRTAYDQISDDLIMSAKSQPKGCSDVRWRIELRRRARSEYYQCCGDALDNTPHFDTRGRG